MEEWAALGFAGRGPFPSLALLSSLALL